VRFIGPSRHLGVPPENMKLAGELLDLMRERTGLDITRRREDMAQRILQGEPQGGGSMAMGGVAAPVGLPISEQAKQPPRELSQAELLALGGAGYPAEKRDITQRFEGYGGEHEKPPTRKEMLQWQFWLAQNGKEMATTTEKIIELERKIENNPNRAEEYQPKLEKLQETLQEQQLYREDLVEMLQKYRGGQSGSPRPHGYVDPANGRTFMMPTE
jgi:hypothetical protein